MLQTFQPVADDQGLAFSVELDDDAARDDDDGSPSPSAGAQEPALQRLQVHRARRGGRADGAELRRLGPDSRAARASGLGHRPQRHRHGYRHQGRAARRPFSKPSPRPTARPRASTAEPGSDCRSAATSWPARRGDRADERAGRGQHVHRLSPAGGRGRRRRRDKQQHHPGSRRADRVAPTPAVNGKATSVSNGKPAASIQRASPVLVAPAPTGRRTSSMARPPARRCS